MKEDKFEKIEKRLNEQISELCLNAMYACRELHNSEIEYNESETKITLNYFGMQLEAYRDKLFRSFGPWKYYVNGNEVAYWNFDIRKYELRVISLMNLHNSK